MANTEAVSLGAPSSKLESNATKCKVNAPALAINVKPSSGRKGVLELEDVPTPILFFLVFHGIVGRYRASGY
jgi:hypothetical protein